jgi:hypothetical protein
VLTYPIDPALHNDKSKDIQGVKDNEWQTIIMPELTQKLDHGKLGCLDHCHYAENEEETVDKK